MFERRSFAVVMALIAVLALYVDQAHAASGQWIPNQGEIETRQVSRAPGAQKDYVDIRFTNITALKVSILVKNLATGKTSETYVGGARKTVDLTFEVPKGSNPPIAIWYRESGY